MITEEHFETLQKVREEAANLRLACIAFNKTGSMLHIAYDRGASLSLPAEQSALVGKLRSVQ